MRFPVFVLLLALALPAAAQELPTSPASVRPLLIGQEVPDGQLLALDGTAHSVADVLDSKPTAIVLYRGGW